MRTIHSLITTGSPPFSQHFLRFRITGRLKGVILVRFRINLFFDFRENLTSDIHQEIKCGDAFPRDCEKSRYRTYDGSCNNLNDPTWGMANTRYGRLLPANYGDGKIELKIKLFSFDEIRLDSGKEELILSKWEISGNAKVRLSNAKSKLLLLLLFLITIERACTNALWERKWIKNRKVYLHGKERCDYDLYCNAKFVKWNVKLSLKTS